MEGDHWPDGAPVTPWADPWHDVLADVRASMDLMQWDADYWGVEINH